MIWVGLGGMFWTIPLIWCLQIAICLSIENKLGGGWESEWRSHRRTFLKEHHGIDPSLHHLHQSEWGVCWKMTSLQPFNTFLNNCLETYINWILYGASYNTNRSEEHNNSLLPLGLIINYWFLYHYVLSLLAFADHFANIFPVSSSAFFAICLVAGLSNAE